jgi:hypothetical protein
MEDLSKISPLLSKIKKETPFSVPDGYFDDLASRIEVKATTSNKPHATIRFLHAARPYIAIAASIVLIFSVWLIFSPKLSTKTEISNLNTDTMIEMSDLNLLNINENELMQIISDEQTKENVNVASDSEALIEYLSDQQIDYSEIENLY